ncbi:MAG TPA: glycosyl hydrolase [Lacipirellulaceae bacterium]
MTATASAQVYSYEAETGTRDGTVIRTSTPGYSGTGYVNFDAGNSVSVQANVPDGLYELWLRYNSPYGFKGYDFQVDGVTGSGGFDGNGSDWSWDRAGAFDLTGATNTLTVSRGWGYYNVDEFQLRPFTPPTLLPVTTQLSDPHVNRRTQMLMNYLVSQYGQKTLSGQQGDVGSNGSFPLTDYLSKSGGIVPAIRGSDFIDYSPSRIAHGSNPNGETERMINWAKTTGGIPSMMWHWNAPTDLIDTVDHEWWRGFYTDSTTFDVQAALASPGSPKYNLLVSDIDAIAVQLKKFQDAGVPVIWRPLHEAQGNMPDGDAWFWWGAKGPQAFKDLWHLMYNELTNVKGLHNLIWEFTSSAAQGNYQDWYPGDDVVDMVGLDIYTDPASNMNGQWNDVLPFYNGRKLLALSETGTLPNPSDLQKWDIKWSYFSPWTWDYVRSQYTSRGYTEAQIQTALAGLLNDSNIVNLNGLPLMPWKTGAPNLPGDYNYDGVVDASDYNFWRDSMGQSVAKGNGADGNGNGLIDSGDYDVWRLYFGQTSAGGASSAAVPEPAAWLLAISGFAGLAWIRLANRGLSAVFCCR